VRVNAQERVKEDSARLARAEMNEFEARHRDDFSIDFFKMYDLYIDRLNEEARLADSKLAEMKPDLEEARGKALEASRRKRVVELLKERQVKKHTDEARRSERKALADQQIMAQSSVPFGGASYTTNPKEYANEPFQFESNRPSVRSEEYDDETTGLEDSERGRNEDALSDYYRQLGIPDPRQ